jgi:hypothetical protein
VTVFLSPLDFPLNSPLALFNCFGGIKLILL